MSITQKVSLLNDSDLSKLSGRLEQLRKKALNIQVPTGSTANNRTTSGTSGGLTAEQLLNELKKAQRSAS